MMFQRVLLHSLFTWGLFACTLQAMGNIEENSPTLEASTIEASTIEASTIEASRGENKGDPIWNSTLVLEWQDLTEGDPNDAQKIAVSTPSISQTRSLSIQERLTRLSRTNYQFLASPAPSLTEHVVERGKEIPIKLKVIRGDFPVAGKTGYIIFRHPEPNAIVKQSVSKRVPSRLSSMAQSNFVDGDAFMVETDEKGEIDFTFFATDEGDRVGQEVIVAFLHPLYGYSEHMFHFRFVFFDKERFSASFRGIFYVWGILGFAIVVIMLILTTFDKIAGSRLAQSLKLSSVQPRADEQKKNVIETENHGKSFFEKLAIGFNYLQKTFLLMFPLFPTMRFYDFLIRNSLIMDGKVENGQKKISPLPTKKPQFLSNLDLHWEAWGQGWVNLLLFLVGLYFFTISKEVTLLIVLVFPFFFKHPLVKSLLVFVAMCLIFEMLLQMPLVDGSDPFWDTLLPLPLMYVLLFLVVFLPSPVLMGGLFFLFAQLAIGQTTQIMGGESIFDLDWGHGWTALFEEDSKVPGVYVVWKKIGILAIGSTISQAIMGFVYGKKLMDKKNIR